ncbi:hypothetical protein AB3662_06475 [Sorangium cellulosum]|uniref:hypothetical protein n=1 Tax=Sorangium cellulosum TaxID=56 RepID=UPI003D9AA2E9
MTPENRRRMLRALVAAVRVKEETGVVEVEFVNFSADANSQENRRRMLRALVAAVRVKEETGVVEVEFVNFSADANSQEAAA